MLVLRNWVNCSIYHFHDVSAIYELLEFLDYSKWMLLRMRVGLSLGHNDPYERRTNDFCPFT